MLLIGAKCDINSQNIQGKTPLHYAVQETQNEVVNTFYYAGCNQELFDQDGNSAYHYAKQRGNKYVAKLLDSSIDVQIPQNVAADVQFQQNVETQDLNSLWIKIMTTNLTWGLLEVQKIKVLKLEEQLVVKHCGTGLESFLSLLDDAKVQFIILKAYVTLRSNINVRQKKFFLVTWAGKNVKPVQQMREKLQQKTIENLLGKSTLVDCCEREVITPEIFLKKLNLGNQLLKIDFE